MKLHAYDNLKGLRFGSWIVIGFHHADDRYYYWNCKCDCGNETIMRPDGLKRVQELGYCRKCKPANAIVPIDNLSEKDQEGVRRREDGLFFHTIIVNGVIAYGYTKYGQCYLVDSADVSKVSLYSWGYKGRGYVTANVMNKERYLHNYLLDNFETGLYIDHINLDKRDNRRENLRICSLQQNAFNQGKPITNTSGLKGVTKDKKGRWKMTITFCQCDLRISGFQDPSSAAAAYDLAAEILFGEYCWTNANHVDGMNGVLLPKEQDELLNKASRFLCSITWWDTEIVENAKKRLYEYATKAGCDISIHRHNYRERTGNGVSGFKGVIPSQKREGFWASLVSFGGKKMYIGAFPSAKEAAAAYDLCAEILKGSSVWLNRRNRVGIPRLSPETEQSLLVRITQFILDAEDRKAELDTRAVRARLSALLNYVARRKEIEEDFSDLDETA